MSGRLYDHWRPPYIRPITCVGSATLAGQLSEGVMTWRPGQHLSYHSPLPGKTFSRRLKRVLKMRSCAKLLVRDRPELQESIRPSGSSGIVMKQESIRPNGSSGIAVLARVDPTEQELRNCYVARVDPTERELGNCNEARVNPIEQELGNYGLGKS
ncbi:hypothetical protein B296_00032814 [Ensete ventricosum]|uniref:Uncharacterized protein n=1 Tax=Ensete ventricosum TaxID=4639 RepID=A0A426YFL4_ENSVE|nr:hypothetical protein B296_00032814 [Ensete ventricosum]